MKTITFEGKQYEVEDWVKFAFISSVFGGIVMSDKKPVKLDNKYELPKNARFIQLGVNCNWQDSLIEV